MSTEKKILARKSKEKFFLVYPTGGVVLNKSVCTTMAIARSSSKVVEAFISSNSTAKQIMNVSKKI